MEAVENKESQLIKAFYPCIDEHLESTYHKLWRTKEYKDLVAQQDELLTDLHENLSENFTTLFEKYVDLSDDIKENEKYYVYLTGFINGILFSNYLKETN